MTYYQCLIKSGNKERLVWLPVRYAHPDLKFTIKYEQPKVWNVEDVFPEDEDEVYDGKKLIWLGKAHRLFGDKLEERLRLDKKMLTEKRIEPVET